MMGGIICTAGFVASYWANGIYFLYISYGVIAGTGLGMCYLSSVIAVGEYFDERRSLAFGMAASGAGVGTAVMALAQQALLNEYGWQGTMLILAGISGMHQIACAAHLRPLSSSLNWRTKTSKLKLISKGSEHLGKDELYKDIYSDTADPSFYIESQNNLIFKHKPDEPMASDIEEILIFDSNESMLCHGKGKTSDSQMNHELCSKSSTEFQMPFSLRHHVLKQTVARGCRSYNSSMQNISAGANASIIARPYSVYLPDSTETLRADEKIAHDMHLEDRKSKPKSSMKIQFGDALYLSSLSIASSRAAAKSIAVEKRKCDRYLYQSQSFDTGNAPSSPRSCLRDVADVHGEKENGFDSKDQIQKDMDANDVLRSLSSNIHFSAETPQPHLTHSEESKYPHLFKNILFYSIAINQFFTGLGVLVPFVHITEKAILMGFGSTRAVLLVSFIGIGNVIGKILLGMLCDMKFLNRFFIFFISQVGMTTSVLLVPFFSSFESMVVFALTFGFCYGNYSAIPSLIAEYVGLNNLARAMGYITFLEGVSAIIGPPLAGHIYDTTLDYNIAFAIAGVFLCISCVTLLPVPIFYQKVTGKPSKLKTYLISCVGQTGNLLAKTKGRKKGKDPGRIKIDANANYRWAT